MIRIYSKDLRPSKEQEHYLLKVMRLKEGNVFHIFHEQGEFEMTACKWTLGPQVRTKQEISIKALAFSLIKPHRLSFLIEKSVELGVTHLFPLVTDHTQFSQFKQNRYEKIIIEATEQCGRLSPPCIEELQPLKIFLMKENLKIPWFFGDLEGITSLLPPSYGIIIGPEGGFSTQEIILLRQHAKGIRLSNNILRTETAAIIGLSL